MRRSLLVLGTAFALVTGACAAKGHDTGSPPTSAGRTTTTAAATSAGRFGTMASPCGPDVDGKKITLEASEAGRGTDKIYVGVANDRTSEIRPGLNKELWDSMVAFSNWCNRQGGIGGLPVEPVDLDGEVFKVEQAMNVACSQTFAMVGGGWAQDNLAFTGKDGSDFHRCKMIAFPAFAVSTDFSDANGVVQAMANLGYVKPITATKVLADLYPEQVKKTTVVYGEGLDSLRINRDQNLAMMKAAGGYGFVGNISFKLLNNDFALTAQKILDLGATNELFVGEPESWAALLAELKTKGWKGVNIADTNEYDPKLFSKGPSAANGALVRIGIHPFEEANRWPATKQFLQIMKQDGPPDAKVASLGISSFSNALLFATAVDDCAKTTGGLVTRACVVTSAKKITRWDAGGLHAPSDISGASSLGCTMLVEAKDGTFVRRYPKIGSKQDAGGGFACDPSGVIHLQGDFGHGNVDPSLPY
jgi:hypothetical protein